VRRDEAEATVVRIFRDEMARRGGAMAVNLESNLARGLELDSVAFVRALVKVEGALRIRFTESDLEFDSTLTVKSIAERAKLHLSA
jgi:acyl carrier protein